VLVLSVVVAINHHHHLNHQQVVSVSMSYQPVKLLATHLKPMLLGPDMVLMYEVLVSMLIPTHKLFDDKH
jgi:hypothetical protein